MAAASAIGAILTHARTIDDRLAEDAKSGALAGMEPRDLALLRSIVVVALRRLGTIRLALAAFLEKPLPRKAQALENVLIAGAAQILFLDIPDHSAVDLAVRSAKHEAATAPFANLVNAVLRNVIRHREELIDPADPFADTPQWLAARWKNNWGEEAARAIAHANRLEPTLDLTTRSDPEAWASRLDGIVLPTGTVRLRSRTSIEQLEGYADGAWWVQDYAAALPARLLDVQPGEIVADLCAAPGGKTAQLAAAGAGVTAVDRSALRLKRLTENLARLKLEANVRAADATAFEGGPFDAILIDAPCTATGTIRRHPEVAWNKRQSDLASLSALQAKLLDRAASLLKPGGRLVYCTCSLEPEEGEQQVSALLRRNPDLQRHPVTPEEIGGLPNCINAAGELRTMPHFLDNGDPRLSGMDGFFAVRLRRRK
ncbi:MAG: RsmB/NOP family class I SAM-dependent RNA methyltransferase [Beijerinckiaceae bacterium]